MANTDTTTVPAKRNGNGIGHNIGKVTTLAQALNRAKHLGTANGEGRNSEIELFIGVAEFALNKTIVPDTADDPKDDQVRSLVESFYTASDEAATLDQRRKGLKNADGSRKKDTIDNKVSKFRHAARLGAVEGIDLETFFDNVRTAIPQVRIPAGKSPRQAFECYVTAAKLQHTSETPKTLVSVATLKKELAPSVSPPRTVTKRWETIANLVNGLYENDDKKPETKAIRDLVVVRYNEWKAKTTKK